MNEDDCGPDFAQWFAEVGQQEYLQWLADPIAQAEYQQYLETLNKECKHEMD